jgi:hypothetical protein
MDVGELHLIVRIEFIGVDQERYTSTLIVSTCSGVGLIVEGT